MTKTPVLLCLSLLLPLGLAGQDSLWGIQRLGYTVQPERDSGGGLGVTLGGFWRVGPRVSFGVEAGYHRLGVERHSFVDPTVGLTTDQQQESIYQFGLIMVGELAQGRWRPYFLAGPVLNLRRFELRTTRPDPSGPVRIDGKFKIRGGANDEGVTGGFGVMAPRLWDPLGIAFEFRWFAISRGVADDDFFSFEEVDHNLSFTVGLVF